MPSEGETWRSEGSAEPPLPACQADVVTAGGDRREADALSAIRDAGGVPHESRCQATGSTVCALGMSVDECQTLRRRLAGLVRIRWLVILSCAAILAVGAAVFPQRALWAGLFATLSLLAIANSTWHLWIRRLSVTRCKTANSFATWQITVDFLLLTGAVYFTGGINSPLTPLFILHGVFSAILLAKRLAARVVVLTAVLVAASLGAGSIGIETPPWAFQPGGSAPEWVSQLLRFACLAIALSGATLQGIGLAQEMRRRHARIADLARVLEARNNELRRLDQQRLRLLSVASHDLRSPMAAVESHIDLFLQDYVPGVTDAQKVYLNRMKVRLRALRGFVTDLLDLVAVESKGVPTAEARRVDLVAQLREVVADQEAVAQAAGVEIQIVSAQETIVVVGPTAHLYLVWANLISNAIKYSAGRSPLIVRLVLEGSEVAISVQDQGIGISDNDQQGLFQDFYRSPAVRKAKIPGTGLGLSIVRHVVEAAGGRVSVSSKLGEGTTFTVRLPLVALGRESVGSAANVDSTVR